MVVKTKQQRFAVTVALTLAVALGNSAVLQAQPIQVIEAQPSRGANVNVSNSGNPAANAAAANAVVVQRSTQAAAPATNMQGEMFVQLQQLQAEMMRLRGLVEEQAHEINLLKQRRMDDYLDLDRRIAELSGGAASATTPASAPTAKSTSTGGTSISRSTASATSKNPNNDAARDAYRSAYQLVKARDFGKAKTAFQGFLRDYPGSSYQPNAHYWLGELYYLDSDLEQARQSFVLLIEQYPQHRKVADASFKLGKVHHQLGDTAKAKSLMQQVVREHPGTSAAKLASDYLAQSLR